MAEDPTTTDLDDDLDPAPTAEKAKPPILMIGIAVVVAALVGAGAAMFLGGGTDPAVAEPTETHEDPDDHATASESDSDASHDDDGHDTLADAPAEAAVPGDLVTAGPHTVNLADGGFVRLSVGVLFEAAHVEEETEEDSGGGHGGGGGDDDAHDGPAREAVTAADGIITHLRTLTSDDFADDAGQVHLKADLAQVFADAYHLDVIDIYIVDLVVTG